MFIGATELLGLLAQDTNLNGSFWSFMANFNINTAGFVIVGVFVVTWVIALGVWRFGRIEQKWDTRPAVTADTPDDTNGPRRGFCQTIAERLAPSGVTDRSTRRGHPVSCPNAATNALAFR